jgi:hypothetical protein
MVEVGLLLRTRLVPVSFRFHRALKPEAYSSGVSDAPEMLQQNLQQKPTTKQV